MSAKREVTTRAVVIGRAQAGEGSVRVHLYTEELGLVSAIAKSAREERSKLRAHLTTGTYGSFALVKGERGWRVTGATGTKNAHFVASDNTEAQIAFAHVIGVVRQLVHGEGANHQLFNALWGFVTVPPMKKFLEAEQDTVLHILASLGYVAPTDMQSPDVVSVINKGLVASGLV